MWTCTSTFLVRSKADECSFSVGLEADTLSVRATYAEKLYVEILVRFVDFYVVWEGPKLANLDGFWSVFVAKNTILQGAGWGKQKIWILCLRGEPHTASAK